MSLAIPPMTVESASDPLDALLHRAFGFRAFRANQEAVCQAAIEGRDVLLVMPTGAGKSLCYQLPALARGGTTLVVSPLIALMEDQVAKLAALGLSVARIHSGLDRTTSRQACIDYLSGTLNFLFIAPGAPARARIRRDAGQAQAEPDRDRRGALHLAVGPRFSPGLSHARAIPARAAARAGDRADGDSHSCSAERHHSRSWAWPIQRASSMAFAVTI